MDTRQVNVIISEAAKKIAGIELGTSLPHLVIEEMLGVQRLEEPQKYYRLVSKLRNELIRDYGIFLETDHKIGYRTCKRGDEIKLCAGEVRSGIRKIWKATAKTQFIRVDEIKDSEKRAQTIAMAQKLANLTGMLKAGQVELLSS